MGESSAAYIRVVQHLIEECILFNMSREECVDALSKHASIMPVVTSTVWKELEKVNKEFFEAYAKDKRETGSTEMETRQRIQQILLDSSKKETKNDHDSN